MKKGKMIKTIFRPLVIANPPERTELLNTTDSTLRKRKARLKEKMPENLYSLFFS